MSKLRQTSKARTLGAVQAAGGAALVAGGGGFGRGLGVSPALPRLLGLRLALQGVVLASHPTRRALTAGAVVDAVHGASMIALLVVAPRHRSAAAAGLVPAAASLAGAAMVGGT